MEYRRGSGISTSERLEDEMALREPIDSLTGKAARVAEMADHLLGVVDGIRDRVLAPRPEVATDGPKPPSPDHIVFSLESAETSLRKAIKIAQAIAEAV